MKAETMEKKLHTVIRRRNLIELTKTNPEVLNLLQQLLLFECATYEKIDYMKDLFDAKLLLEKHEKTESIPE